MTKPWELTREEILDIVNRSQHWPTQRDCDAAIGQTAQGKLWQWLEGPDDEHDHGGGSWARMDCEECRARVDRALLE